MKVECKKIDSPYNQWGCGYRLLFLIKYKNTRWNRGEYSIALNRRLNKLIEYWNYHGNSNGRESILKNQMFVPIDTLGETHEKDYRAIETERYGYYRCNYLSKGNLYYREES